MKLESVGTVLESDGMTYPMLEGGGYDADQGIHLEDIEAVGEWWDNLSDADYDTVTTYINEMPSGAFTDVVETEERQ